MKEVTIYTDGACLGNPGPGGWGVLFEYQGEQKTLSGSEKETTNNRMELQAVIQALRALKEPCQVELYTDSKYVMKGMTEWIQGWKKRNWKNSKGKDVKNIDLWMEIDVECSRHSLRWHWVKGHAGHPGNEAADALASKAARNV